MQMARAFLIAFVLSLSLLGTARTYAAEDGRKAGVHLVLQLDAQEVTAYWLASLRDEVRNRLRTGGIAIGRLISADGKVQLRLAKPEDADGVLKLFADLAPTPPDGLLAYYLTRYLRAPGSDVTFDKGEGGAITITPTQAAIARRVQAALDDAAEVARKRLAGLAVAADVSVLVPDRIRVYAPAVTDSAVLKALLVKPGRLGFHEVHPTISAEQARRERVPLGFKIVADTAGDMLLRESPSLRGSDLVEAQPAFDSRTGEPVLSFRFNGNGTRAFAKFTAEHIGQPFAIVLDDVILAAPVIREPILGGSGQVSGNFTLADTQNLAVQLRAGALPARLTVIEERIVPPAR